MIGVNCLVTGVGIDEGGRSLGGINRCEVGRLGICEHNTSGIGCRITRVRVNGYWTWWDRDGVNGCGICVRCAYRVDGDVTRDGIAEGNGGGVDGRGLRGVACNGTEAKGLFDLCCLVEPRRFMQCCCVQCGAGCR